MNANMFWQLLVIEWHEDTSEWRYRLQRMSETKVHTHKWGALKNAVVYISFVPWVISTKMHFFLLLENVHKTLKAILYWIKRYCMISISYNVNLRYVKLNMLRLNMYPTDISRLFKYWHILYHIKVILRVTISTVIQRHINVTVYQRHINVTWDIIELKLL